METSTGKAGSVSHLTRPHSHDDLGRGGATAAVPELTFSDGEEVEVVDDGADAVVETETKLVLLLALRVRTKARCSRRPMKRARTKERRTKTATMESRMVELEGSAERVRSTSVMERDILGMGGMEDGSLTLRSILQGASRV